jgi:hypothetical protein
MFKAFSVKVISSNTRDRNWSHGPNGMLRAITYLMRSLLAPKMLDMLLGLNSMIATPTDEEIEEQRLNFEFEHAHNLTQVNAFYLAEQHRRLMLANSSINVDDLLTEAIRGELGSHVHLMSIQP